MAGYAGENLRNVSHSHRFRDKANSIIWHRDKEMGQQKKGTQEIFIQQVDK